MDAFVKSTSIRNEGTAHEYEKRLKVFSKFVHETYELSLDELIETLTIQGRGPKIDVYNLFTNYISYLHKKGTMSSSSIKARVLTARSFLETNDIDISPRKWQLKIRMPRIGRTEKAALSKEDIQTILNACSSIKLKTYLLFLAATGTRATETLSIRLCDINFDTEPATVFLRSEFTKSRVSRSILLTSELTEQLKKWLKYKYRPRSIGYYDKNTGKTDNVKKTPTVNKQMLIFGSYDHDGKGPSLRGLYTRLLIDFEGTLERLGGRFAEYENEDENKKRRRKYTFHSLRRFVKTTISDLGYQDFSEFFIGHSGSTYYRKNEKEKIELFRRVEPYLTYLDVSALETRSADVQSRLDSMEQENRELKERYKKYDELLEKVAEQVGL